MCPDYGRAEGGKRVKAAKPKGTWKNISIIAALAMTGLVSVMYGEWATDEEAFLAFVEEMLIPNVTPGKIIIMDNIPFHKTPAVKQAILRAKLKLIFLPPYSPDLSPIESMWSKVKNILKQKAARTIGVFHQALGEALESLTDCDCESWFEDCGYIDN